MSKQHTFIVTAYPCEVEQHDGYSTMRIGIWQHNRVQGTVTVATPGDVAPALQAWAESLTLPTENLRGEPVSLNAWSVSVRKPSTNRWPAGFKQAAEQSHTFTVGYPES
jgi:hypothetical protein